MAQRLTNAARRLPDAIDGPSPPLTIGHDLRSHSPMRRAFILFAIVMLAGAAGCSQEPADATRPAAALASQGRVTDAAQVISASAKARITATLAAYERRTGHQVVVVTVRSLGGKPIAKFAKELGNAWGIGRKDHSDGVIVLVAPVERTVRIAVGRGLEKALTDERAARVIHDVMVPQFKEGRIEAGIEQGTGALIAELDQAEGLAPTLAPTPVPEHAPVPRRSGAGS